MLYPIQKHVATPNAVSSTGYVQREYLREYLNIHRIQRTGKANGCFAVSWPALRLGLEDGRTAPVI